MVKWLHVIPAGIVSLTFFVGAGIANDGDTALFLAFIGSMVPVVAMSFVAIGRMLRWRNMGKELGLVALPGGAYPEMRGRFHGRRLLICRRANPFGGRGLVSLVSLEGAPDVRLPGLLQSAQEVRQALLPLLPEDDASGAGVNAGHEA
jgi:hypothetical protein